MCMLRQTQGRVGRPQATENTAPESWDSAQCQCVAQACRGCGHGTKHSDRVWNPWLEVILGLQEVDTAWQIDDCGG